MKTLLTFPAKALADNIYSMQEKVDAEMQNCLAYFRIELTNNRTCNRVSMASLLLNQLLVCKIVCDRKFGLITSIHLCTVKESFLMGGENFHFSLSCKGFSS